MSVNVSGAGSRTRDSTELTSDLTTNHPMHAITKSIVLLILAAGAAAGQDPGSAAPRLIVLGFDGLDHARLERLMREEPASFENLRAVADAGTMRRLETSNPAVSPVAWSCLVTGLNPGSTGIDGFLRRDFSHGDVRVKLALGDRVVDRGGMRSRGTRRAVFAIPVALFALLSAWALRRGKTAGFAWWLVATVAAGGVLWMSETALPDGFPRPVNLRQGEAYWETLDDDGVDTTTLGAPCSFPAPYLDHGHLLCGLGVPDVMGTPGFWTIFRDDVTREDVTETGGFIKPLVYQDPDAGDGRFELVSAYGPVDFIGGTGARKHALLGMTLNRSAGSVMVTDHIDHHALLTRGRWSEPFPLLFRMSPLVRVRGRARMKLLSSEDPVKIYLEPVGFHPGELPRGVRLSNPDLYALELEKEIGPYETVGWACATNPLKDGAIDERTFLEDAYRVWDEQEKLAELEIGRSTSRVITSVITVPDRIQHMFTRYEWSDRDTRGRLADPRYARVVDDVYRRVDGFVGRVRELMHPGDELLIVSDHGFSPWRRAVNLNVLLVREGLLVMRDRTGRKTLEHDLRTGVAFDDVDWSKTKAYAMGLSKIYVNLAGREPQGIVSREEAAVVVARIERMLRELEDDGRPVVKNIYRGASIYAGDAIPEGAADVYVGFHRGYRVSWQNCLGGVDEPAIFENGSAWSGDHCGVDPSVVPGVIITTLDVEDGRARTVDVGPTVLDWAGHPAPPLPSSLDGRSILRRP